jgi:hypothetical protein
MNRVVRIVKLPSGVEDSFAQVARLTVSSGGSLVLLDFVGSGGQSASRFIQRKEALDICEAILYCLRASQEADADGENP